MNAKVTNQYHLGLAFLLPMLLTSCGVFMTQPFPVNHPPLDKEQLEGTWQAGDDIYQLRYGIDGIGYCGSLKWEDDAFKVETTRFFTTTGKANRYIAIEYTETNAPPLYLLYRYSFPSEHELALWEPDLKWFQQAVDEGKLTGEVKYKHAKANQTSSEPAYVILTTQPLDIVAYLDDPSRSNHFSFPSGVFRKVSKSNLSESTSKP
jgi:hypothetical protein